MSLLWEPELSSSGEQTAAVEEWTELAYAPKAALSVVGAAALLTSIFGMGTCVPVTSATQHTGVGIEWTNQSIGRRAPQGGRNSPTTGLLILEHVTPGVRPAKRDLGTADQIRLLHERSGLTWDQLGRLFGVSRRAVHNWASGSRLSAGNAETLARVVAALSDRANYDPDENRDWFLRAHSGGRSLFDDIRVARKQGDPIDEVLSVRERLGMA